MKKHYIIPFFIPFLGCPHKCAFCDQEKITGTETRYAKEAVTAQITSYLKTIDAKSKEQTYIEVGYFGGSFTGLPFTLQKDLLVEAKSFVEEGIIDGIRVSTRPDYITKDILDFLRENSVSTIEIGAQSLDSEVLLKSKRGHLLDNTIQAAELIKKGGFNLGLQLMIGLPGDTMEKSIISAKRAAALQPDFVRIYPTLVLKGTELAKQYSLGQYIPWELDEIINAAKKMYYIFTQQDIKVIRIGLQDSAELKKDHLVAGPYHPATGELVQAAVYLDMIGYLVKQNFKKLTDDVYIYCSIYEQSKIRGQKNTNIIELNKWFPQYHFHIKPTSEIPKNS
ncbi:MAG: radical SAM protein, partial [Bacillota bacterium]|nr:radical SAM protein [Bacillota bacterium]